MGVSGLRLRVFEGYRLGCGGLKELRVSGLKVKISRLRTGGFWERGGLRGLSYDDTAHGTPGMASYNVHRVSG